jgi:hypothetical protein
MANLPPEGAVVEPVTPIHPSTIGFTGRNFEPDVVHEAISGRKPSRDPQNSHLAVRSGTFFLTSQSMVS